jgi:hypothetical protein
MGSALPPCVDGFYGVLRYVELPVKKGVPYFTTHEVAENYGLARSLAGTRRAAISSGRLLAMLLCVSEEPSWLFTQLNNIKPNQNPLTNGTAVLY